MELWIRSQDKIKLVKVNYVYIMESNNHFTIYGETIDSSPIIGTYKIKERALEVLDEIQKLLQPQMVLSKVGKPIAETCDGTVYVNPNEYEIKELSTYVYEMPKE